MVHGKEELKIESFKDLDSLKKENKEGLDGKNLDSMLKKYLSNYEEKYDTNNGNIGRTTPEKFFDGFNNVEEAIRNTNLRRNINLSPTPLSYFPEDELVVYFRDFIYFPSSQEVHHKYNLKFFGEKYFLAESESFLEIEKEHLRNNEEEINSLKSDYIKRLSKENRIIKEKYKSLENSLRNSDSIDSLVRNYFFPITKNINLEKVISENKKKETSEKNIDATKIRELGFDHKSSFFSEILGARDYPILITNGNFYEISNRLKIISDKRGFDSKYKKFIGERIKKKIKENVDSYFIDVLKKDEEIVNLNRFMDDATSYPGNNFGADKISKNEYVLFKNTGEYGVEWNGKFYVFPDVSVGVDLTKTSSGYKIGERAFVYKDPYYKHPYIQGEKGRERREICTAGRLGRIHSQIRFKRSERDKANLMMSAKSLLHEFENILKRGHNSDHEPFDSIPESAKLLSKFEAERYERRGIKFFQKTYGN